MYKHKKSEKFQSGFLDIFWPEMIREVSKILKNRILVHPLPRKVDKTASAISAKKFQSHFFGLFSPLMDAESKITPWKTILDDPRGVQGVWDQKMSKISNWFFGHFLVRYE